MSTQTQPPNPATGVGPGHRMVVLPPRDGFTQLVLVCARAASAQRDLHPDSDPGAPHAAPRLAELADALHLRLEGSYSDPDKRAFVPLPAPGDFLLLVEQVVQGTAFAEQAAEAAGSVLAVYLYLFLAGPLAESDRPADGAALGKLAPEDITRLVDDRLPHPEAFRVATALLLCPSLRSRVWNTIVDVPAAGQADQPRTRTPHDEVDRR